MNSSSTRSVADTTKIINAIEEIGGPRQIIRQAKLKVQFTKSRDARGFDACSLFADINLELLSPELRLFTIEAMSRAGSIGIDRKSLSGSPYDTAFYQRSLCDKHISDKALQLKAQESVRELFEGALTKHFGQMKNGAASYGLSGAAATIGQHQPGAVRGFINRMLNKDARTTPVM